MLFFYFFRLKTFMPLPYPTSCLSLLNQPAILSSCLTLREAGSEWRLLNLSEKTERSMRRCCARRGGFFLFRRSFLTTRQKYQAKQWYTSEGRVVGPAKMIRHELGFRHERCPFKIGRSGLSLLYPLVWGFFSHGFHPIVKRLGLELCFNNHPH